MRWHDQFVNRFSRTRGGGWILLHLFTPLDRRLMRWSGGRLNMGVGSRLGRQTLLLTTVGRKGGQERSVPLLYTAVGEDLVLVASRAGHAENPAWYYNLKAQPTCRVVYGGREVVCTAREADGDERRRLWAEALTVYGGYADYAARTKRRIPVLVLTPTAPATDPRRARRLLLAFDKRASVHRRALDGRFDAEAREEVIAAARSKLEQLAGEIPYAGRDRHPMAPNIVEQYPRLGFALVLRERGCTTEEIGAFFHDSFVLPYAWLPLRLVLLLRRPLAWLSFRRMAAVAEASQRRERPDEFVLAVPTPPPGADHALEIQECAVCKVFAKHGEERLVPYICALDDVISDAGQLGLRRTGTRALGAERCDFVYRFGGEPLRLADRYDLGSGRRL